MMKKKYFLNANIIDPKNGLEEIGGLIVNEEGKIEAVGKKVNKNNIPSREKFIDLKEKYIFPGLVDMRVFVCLLYTSPSPRDATLSRMPSSA